MQPEKESFACMILLQTPMCVLQCSCYLQIGINYIGQPEALQGCIEDVYRMKRFLLG